MPEVGHRQAAASVTVVIVSYRCRDLLANCLASLHTDVAEGLARVAVVDNDSGDGTAEMVGTEFPWVELRAVDDNLGFSKANNLVLREVATEFVLLLNPDAVVPAGALGRSLAELRRRPGVGVLGCKLVRADGTLDHACRRSFPTIANSLLYFTHLDRLRPFARPGGYATRSLSPDQPGEVDAINGAFMLVRSSALKDVGVLDERFWMYGEDLDWCLRFWQHDWAVYYWPEVEVLHLKGATDGGQRSRRANRAFHEAMWLFYEKHHAGEHGRLLNATVRLGIHLRWRLRELQASRRAQRRPDAAAGTR